MKKRFITKKRRKFRVLKIVLFLTFFIGTLIFTFTILNKSNISINNQKLVEVLLYNINNEKSSIITKFKSLFSTKVLFLDNNYFNERRVFNDKSGNNLDNNTSTNNLPTIYIYNSHQSEEYSYSSFLEYMVSPTVMFADYVLEGLFKDAGYISLVEERSVKEVLNRNGWKYSYSYMASRTLMEEAFLNNPSLKYFIDVHRDSLSKEKTSVTIEGKVFAKTIFLIGLENENYRENLEFTEKINNLMNERYPGLSKGIYKKGGPLVNGVYNQDFSNRVILIEIGGYQNTPSEVLNSVLAFSECFLEVIKTDEV